MTTMQLVVTVAGLAAIAWVNWYFFVAPARVAVTAATAGGSGAGPQTVRIEVAGGYTPSLVRVRAGRPVRLEFHRTETNACSEEVVIPDFRIRRFLPAHETTAVEFTPATAGTHEFTCGMGMLRGKIQVEETVKRGT
jgi:plastocyanin domain-containing protein